MAAFSWDNVLLLQTSFLGDTVLTLPLVVELRRRFPVRKLTIVCQPASRDLLQDHPAIDDLIVDDKKRTDRGWAGLRAKAASLKAKRFTMAITPHKSLRSALLLFLAGIPCRIGFRQSAGWFLYHRRVTRDPQRHDVERNLSVLQAFGVRIEDCERALDLPVSAALQETVDHKLRALGIADDHMQLFLREITQLVECTIARPVGRNLDSIEPLPGDVLKKIVLRPNGSIDVLQLDAGSPLCCLGCGIRSHREFRGHG